MNADNPIVKAGKMMLHEIRGYAARRESFAFETTLSGLGYLRHIRDWRASGYHVTLFFLTLPSIEMRLLGLRSESARADTISPRRSSAGVS